jgi:excisionase family DNA binding protein
MVRMERPTPLLLTVEDAASILRISRSKVYQLMSRGALKSVRVDGSRRIKTADLNEYVASL